MLGSIIETDSVAWVAQKDKSFVWREVSYLVAGPGLSLSVGVGYPITLSEHNFLKCDSI